MNHHKPEGIFQRHEEKYLLSPAQYAALMPALSARIRPDEFCKSTVCNLYFDTPDFRLIRASLEKPVYKEKLRLRSYGVPSPGDKVFLELKKKYRGVVYKRRVSLPLEDAEPSAPRRLRPGAAGQILREIDWFRAFYPDLAPAVFLAYDREAYVCREQPDLRFTFDTGLRWRREDLRLECGAAGAPLLDEGQRLLELKVPEAVPVWLARLLGEAGLYPSSFSKYGAAYQTGILPELARRGGLLCA